jgi:predicted MFS family arabinose efflux permease
VIGLHQKSEPGKAPVARQVGVIGTWLVMLALAGLLLFGAVFAVNSSLHSYMIVRFANSDGVSLDVGFYYMANAMGRLIGTVLSGWVYQQAGLAACLWLSSAMLVATVLVSTLLPKQPA